MQTNFYLIPPPALRAKTSSYYDAYKPQQQSKTNLKFSAKDAFSLKFSQDDRFKRAIIRAGHPDSYYYLPDKGYYDINGHPSYHVSHRGYGEIAGYYPDWVLGQWEKKDGILTQVKEGILKKNDAILDVGAGDGQFVKDLEGEKFTNLTAFDKNVENKHVKKIDIKDLTESSYARQFDHIFSTWSIFTYDESQRFQYECLKKMAAWLKPGGRIYLSPVNKDRIEEFVREIPGLTIQSGTTEATRSRSNDDSNDHYVILTKSDDGVLPKNPTSKSKPRNVSKVVKSTSKPRDSINKLKRYF